MRIVLALVLFVAAPAQAHDWPEIRWRIIADDKGPAVAGSLLGSRSTLADTTVAWLIYTQASLEHMAAPPHSGPYAVWEFKKKTKAVYFVVALLDYRGEQRVSGRWVVVYGGRAGIAIPSKGDWRRWTEAQQERLDADLLEQLKPKG
jgi:hypothetical protein